MLPDDFIEKKPLKGALQNDAAGAVAARDTVHRGRREAANMNVVTGNNNGKKDMAQVCSSVGGEQNNIGCH